MIGAMIGMSETRYFVYTGRKDGSYFEEAALTVGKVYEAKYVRENPENSPPYIRIWGDDDGISMAEDLTSFREIWIQYEVNHTGRSFKFIGFHSESAFRGGSFTIGKVYTPAQLDTSYAEPYLYDAQFVDDKGRVIWEELRSFQEVIH